MNTLIDKAAQHALAEVLGYDEARVYYLLLQCDNRKLAQEFSYSKKYRLMKSLFVQGAVGKCRPQYQELFNYMLLPPSFLYKHEVDNALIEWLEKLYVVHLGRIFTAPYSQVILRDDEALIGFLLKYEMKKQARMFADKSVIKCLSQAQTKKVHTYQLKDDKRKLGVIDGRWAYELLPMYSPEGVDLIGYVVTGNSKEYVSLIENKLPRQN